MVMLDRFFYIYQAGYLQPEPISTRKFPPASFGPGDHLA
jgi:hypothetical protein